MSSEKKMESKGPVFDLAAIRPQGARVEPVGNAGPQGPLAAARSLGQPFVDLALIDAASHGDERACAKALAQGANARAFNFQDHTALHIACLRGEPSCVRLLIPHSDLNARSPGGLTPLMHAAIGGERDVIREVLPGSDPRAVDEEGRAALMHACLVGNLAAMMELLPVSDATAVDAQGRGLLHCVGMGGGEACAKALMGIVDPLAVDAKGQRASELAIKRANGHPGIAGFLKSMEEAAELRLGLGAGKALPVNARPAGL